jgi:NADH pyrophosphatase NudC (nudix superfamily)
LEIVENSKIPQDELNLLEDTVKEIDALNKKYTHIVSETYELSSILDALKITKNSTVSLDELNVLGDTINTINLLNKKYTKIQLEVSEIKRIIDMLAELNELTTTLSSKIQTTKKELVHIQNSFVNCPYCGQKLSESAKGRLLKCQHH